MMVYGLKSVSGTFYRKLEEQVIIGKLGCMLGMGGMNVDFDYASMLN